MKPVPQDNATIHFSTRALPPPQRTRALREHFVEKIRLDIESEPGRSVEMTMQSAHGIRRATMVSPLTARVTRRSQMLSDGVDVVCLMMNTGGTLALTQRGEVTTQVGDGVLLVYREPATVQFVDNTYLSVRVPFDALSTLSRDLESAAGLRIRRDAEPLALLRSYLASLPPTIVDPQLGQASTTHILDLMALAIGASDEVRHLAGQRGVKAARLAAIKADVTEDPLLDVHAVASRRGISARYVQLLFEQSGTTFTEFSIACRLDAARRMLAGPRFTTWSVSAIAFEAGFSDLSHFNRRFKRRFGMTPSDLRAMWRVSPHPHHT